MPESNEKIIWRWIVAGLASFSISLGAYFVNKNDRRLDSHDRRFEELERYKLQQVELTRDQMIRIESRLTRMEEKLDSINQRGVRR